MTERIPDPAKHAAALCEAYGNEQAKWYAETNADSYHAATKEYWRLVLSEIAKTTNEGSES